jgi:transcriptional regulator with XRE-family HTH domain
VAARIAVRIYNLRRKFGWTQAKLAEQAGMKQARISLLEQADYENFSFNTVKRIATAFNVAVIVDFVSFTDFLKWRDEIDTDSAAPYTLTESQHTQAAMGQILGGSVPPTNVRALTDLVQCGGVVPHAIETVRNLFPIAGSQKPVIILPAPASTAHGAAFTEMSVRQ